MTAVMNSTGDSIVPGKFQVSRNVPSDMPAKLFKFGRVKTGGQHDVEIQAVQFPDRLSLPNSQSISARPGRD